MALSLLIVCSALNLLFIFLGQSFWISLVVLLMLLVLFFLTSKNEQIQKKPLIESKIILNISFWSCMALALKSYEKTISCLNCMRTYLNAHLQPTFGANFTDNIKMAWQNYPRFLTIFSLLIAWSIVFVIIQHIKGSKK